MEKVNLKKYEAIGIIEETLERRAPTVWVRGSNPELNMAIAIADVLLQLGYLSQEIYSEVFNYFIKKFRG